MKNKTKIALAVTTVAVSNVLSYAIAREKLKKDLCGKYLIPQPPFVEQPVAIEVLRKGVLIHHYRNNEERVSTCVYKRENTKTELLYHRLKRISYRLQNILKQFYKFFE